MYVASEVNPSPLPLQVVKLFEAMDYTPAKEKEAYQAAWDLRMLFAFALKRARDAAKRGQTPRVSKLK